MGERLIHRRCHVSAPRRGTAAGGLVVRRGDTVPVATQHRGLRDPTKGSWPLGWPRRRHGFPLGRFAKCCVALTPRPSRESHPCAVAAGESDRSRQLDAPARRFRLAGGWTALRPQSSVRARLLSRWSRRSVSAGVAYSRPQSGWAEGADGSGACAARATTFVDLTDIKNH